MIDSLLWPRLSDRSALLKLLLTHTSATVVHALPDNADGAVDCEITDNGVVYSHQRHEAPYRQSISA